MVGHVLDYELKLADNETVHRIGILAWHGMHRVAQLLESRSGQLKLKLLYTLACDWVNFKDQDAQDTVLKHCTWYGAQWFGQIPEDVDKLITDLIIYARHQPVFARDLNGDYIDQVMAILQMQPLDYPPDFSEWLPSVSPLSLAWIYNPDSPPASPSLLDGLSGNFPVGNPATDPLRS
jgi:hypothetical protein